MTFPSDGNLYTDPFTTPPPAGQPAGAFPHPNQPATAPAGQPPTGAPSTLPLAGAVQPEQEHQPSITVEALLARLTELGVVDESKLVAVLGADRYDMTLNRLEAALVEGAVIADERLAEIKAEVSGRPPLPNLDVPTFAGGLDRKIAYHTGTILLDTDPPSVAMVEDTDINVRRVGAAVGRTDFNIHLVTVGQFTELFKATYGDVKLSSLPVADDIYQLLDATLEAQASDLHLTVGLQPRIRSQGELRQLRFRPLDQHWMEQQVLKLFGPEVLDKLNATHSHDTAISYGTNVRFRINIGRDRSGLMWALRLLPSTIPSFDSLGLPRAIREFCNLERGLVIVTGPTGSGKSTTLAALFQHIATTQSRKIVTLEDPVEFLLPSGKSVVNQRELGVSFRSFPDGMRELLRQDPDVVLVGEARDPETISAAVTAAETGALVFTTLHTFDAASTLGRIVSSYTEGEQAHIRTQLSYVLKGIVSQTLLTSTSGGRVAAFEILVGTPGVANNLRKEGGLPHIRQQIVTGAADGMMTLESHLAQLVKAGKVTEAEAEYKARDIEEFRRNLKL